MYERDMHTVTEWRLSPRLCIASRDNKIGVL